MRHPPRRIGERLRRRHAAQEIRKPGICAVEGAGVLHVAVEDEIAALVVDGVFGQLSRGLLRRWGRGWLSRSAWLPATPATPTARIRRRVDAEDGFVRR